MICQLDRAGGFYATCRTTAERCNGGEHLASRPHGKAEFLEVIIRQMLKSLEIDLLGYESASVFTNAHLPQPAFDF